MRTVVGRELTNEISFPVFPFLLQELLLIGEQTYPF